MSTETGDAMIAAAAVAQAKALVDSERAQELRQLDLLDSPSPEEMAEVKQDLGFGATGMDILREARQRRAGRPKGARNKRTDDLAKFLLAHGRHPAVTMMQIQGTPTEVLMQLSGKPYLECLDRQIRCADALLPYFESKKPVAVDMTFNGVADLVIEGVTHTRQEIQDIIEGDFMPIDDEKPE